MKLGEFVMSLLTEAAVMRKNGVPAADVQRGIQDSLIAFAREHGLMVADRDVPYYQMATCPSCRDGWVETTRQHRGQTVEAYRRCGCKATTAAPDHRARAADQVASGWK